jgi:transposase
MRGVALVVAVTVVAEVGDFRRFANARQLMAYLAARRHATAHRLDLGRLWCSPGLEATPA